MNAFVDSLSAAGHLLLSGDPVLWSIVGRSVAVSAWATLLACAAGLVVGAWLAVVSFRGRTVLVTLLNTALALPSVVVGLVVYLLLSRSGPLGFLGWLFSFPAMVCAQAVLVAPVATVWVLQVLSEANLRHGEQLRVWGAGPVWRASLLLWNERRALLAVFFLTFGRAIAEVGAVMVVGGNMEGFTRVMTTAIALETSKGDLPLALALGWVLLVVVLLIHLVVQLLQHGGARWPSKAVARG